jgi:hypothetical protein
MDNVLLILSYLIQPDKVLYNKYYQLDTHDVVVYKIIKMHLMYDLKEMNNGLL